MVYRQDNRPKKHHGRFMILGIVLGIGLTIGGIYVYDNYKQPIIQNVNSIQNTAESELQKTEPLMKSSSQQVARPQTTVQDSSNSQPQVISANSIAQALHILVNLQRVNNGLSALAWDDRLAQVALSHSNDMIQNNYFSHVDLQGDDPIKRIQILPNCETPSENLAWTRGYTPDQVANQMMQFWMGSPEHRSNILRSTISSEGIGVAINGDYIVSTDDFC